MYSKSSTFLALTSILAILAVLSIAINNVENPAVRKPFATSGKENTDGMTALPNGWDSLTGQATQNTAQVEAMNTTVNSGVGIDKVTSEDDQIVKNELKFTAEDQKYFQENFKGLNDSVVNLNLHSEANGNTDTKEITKNLNQVVTKVPNSPVKTTSTDLLVKNVNNDSLRMAGYNNFVIKPKPLEGKMFGEFDVSMLDPLGIIEKKVIENRESGEVLVLDVYEFSAADKDTTNEIYDFLMAQIKADLNVTVNETNQFGLSSFYINFNSAQNSVFLVVKTRDNVYALSYPKANSGKNDYAKLTTSLLKELI